MRMANAPLVSAMLDDIRRNASSRIGQGGVLFSGTLAGSGLRNGDLS
jgi:hypothetical protein